VVAPVATVEPDVPAEPDVLLELPVPVAAPVAVVPAEPEPAGSLGAELLEPHATARKIGVSETGIQILPADRMGSSSFPRAAV
jgi:hypothetical protein